MTRFGDQFMSMDRVTLAWSASHRRDCHDVFASLLTYLQHVRYPANLGPEIDVANTGIG
jgi:hypothetical protein